VSRSGESPGVTEAFIESGRPGSNRRRPAYEGIHDEKSESCRELEGCRGGRQEKELNLDRQRVYIRDSRVLGEDGCTKTGQSKRDVLIHDELAQVLRELKPAEASPADYVFVGPRAKPINQDNFHNREWRPALEALGIRLRPNYAMRHTYISHLLAAGATPLFVARQTGTSLEMIERHYGHHRMTADDVSALIKRRRRAR
jgi:integrase